MKNLLCGLMIMSVTPFTVSASECIEVRGEKFCLGDKVMYPYASSKGQVFGKITAIDTVTKIRTIQMEDGSMLKNNSTVFKQSQTSDCGQFQKSEVCVGDTVSIADLGGGSVVHQIKVLAIAPYSLDNSKLSAYGEVLSGEKKGKIKGSYEVLQTEGQVPGFEHLSLGDLIANPYGSMDQILYYHPSHKYYGLKFGDTKRMIFIEKEQLAFRLSQKTKTVVKTEFYASETLDTNKEADVMKALQFRAELYLKEKCYNMFLTDAVDLKNVALVVKNYKVKREFKKYLSLGHGGGFDMFSLNPRYQATAKLTATATCVHKL